MPSHSLTQWERQRIIDILAAVSAKDWPSFAALSDKPFINPLSMREQFDDSIGQVSDNLNDWETNTTVEARADRTRLICVNLPGKTPEKPVLLILHSSNSGIGIWVFYEFQQS